MIKNVSNSCIREMDRIGLRENINPCAETLQERRHAVGSPRRAVSEKIAVKETRDATLQR